MSKRASKVLVGDLLVKSELVSLAQFADAMPVALKTGLPVGRVLIASGFLPEDSFRQVLTLQSLIRDRLITEEVAIEALKLIAKEKIDLDQALKKLGHEGEFFEVTNRLGQLLIDSGAITASQRDEALAVSMASGLPLARVLSLRGYVNEHISFLALIAQALMRDNRIQRAKAIELLKIVQGYLKQGASDHNFRGTLAFGVKRTNTIRLGELLLLSGMVPEADLVAAVEKGLSDEEPLGQVLIRVGLVDDVGLSQALTVQEMVNNGILSAHDATYVLERVKSQGVSVSKAIVEQEKDKVKGGKQKEQAKVELDQILACCGLISEKDTERVRQALGKDSAAVDAVLSELGVKADVAHAASECLSLVNSQKLSEEEATFVLFILALCAASGEPKSLESILKELGWQK
ncbi:MAG: hypothetical protein JSS86_12095 [Cyanobacteria bacterium SZAS LIN-2]|nr:hypothetical protein [Cyanobacteria bacterium SZAS LIN-3]MBS1997051.1 hypothetical protein [Cyanobacteria bacterium SZAS LIN-2]